MRLTLSRSAAPSMGLADLAALARRRGLDGLEIEAGDLDGATLPADATAWVSSVHVTSVHAAGSPAILEVAAAAGAPVVAARGLVPTHAIGELEALYRRAGAHLSLTHGTDAEEAAALAAAIADAGAAHVSTAWELRPLEEDLSEAAAVLLVAGDSLRYVRLRGGGPELAEQDGSGVGGVFSALALSGYAGPVALAPSGAERAPEWERWLERTGKSGCGTKATRGDVELDMRPVEPRDRLETILGAYRGLGAGHTLHLTLDHDPECMYFTLQATEPEGSFAFERRENGPEVWRVDVSKLLTTRAPRAPRA